MKIRKKVLIILLIVIILLIIFKLFINIENKKGKETDNQDNIAIENIQNDEINNYYINNNIENTIKAGDNKMEIEIAGKIFIASLEDNETTKAFKKLLPLSIKMSELNGNEKYYFLPESIKKDTSKNPGTINSGDIMLYSDNCVVIFYKTFKTSYNYIKIGHIEDLSSLEEDLGNNEVNVKLNLSK